MKKGKSILYALVSIGAVALFATVLNFDNAAAFDTIAAFLSITTGFTIAALSIIATSPFSAHLYSIEDKNDNSRTLLHILVRRFQFTTIIFVTTIGLIILNKFLPKSCSLVVISLSDLLKALIWYMTIVSFWSFVGLFHLFSSFVIRNAAKK